jgi:hypothetical protein
MIHERVSFENQAGGRDVIKTALLSTDSVVRQARPKMMLLLGKTAVAYTIGTPIFIALCALAKINQETMALLVRLILWQGLTLWGAFTTSFTGYTVARSVDKKAAAGLDVSSIMESLAGLGKKISQ